MDLQNEKKSLASALFENQTQAQTVEPNSPDRLPSNSIPITVPSCQNPYVMNVNETQLFFDDNRVNNKSLITEKVESKQEQLLEVTFEYDNQAKVFSIDSQQNDNITPDSANK